MSDAPPPKAKAVDGVERRRWDKAHFAAVAAEKNAMDEEMASREADNERQRKQAPVQRAPLQRDAERDKATPATRSLPNSPQRGRWGRRSIT